MRAILFVASLAAVVAGCASAGPVGASDFQARVEAATPPDAGRMLIAEAGAWRPNSRGYDMRDWRVWGLMNDTMTGVVIVAERGIAFAQWDEERRVYVPVKYIALASMRDVSVATFGLSRTLVVQQADMTFDEFRFLRWDGGVDSERADAAAALLRRAITSSSAGS